MFWKRLKKTQCSEETKTNCLSLYWASEASPTLGCSIEISGDIYCRYVVCHMSVVCQINCVGGITWPTRMLKVFFGRLNQ